MPNWIGIDLLEVLPVANGTRSKDPNLMARFIDLIAVVMQVLDV